MSKYMCPGRHLDCIGDGALDMGRGELSTENGMARNIYNGRKKDWKSWVPNQMRPVIKE